MRLLLIEGKKYFLENIVTDLRKTYIVDIAKNGFDGTYNSQINDYDLIIVGDSLPDIDGVEVCSMIRMANARTPIILLCDCTKPLEKVMSLDAGADVSFSKPINSDELIAQIRALIRRNGDSTCSNVLKVGKLEMDIKSRQVFADGKEIFLRRKEFELLEYLLVHKEKVVSKEELLEHVWEDGINVFSNTVEVHIRSVRSRIGGVLGNDFIKTVRGFGYKIETCENTVKALSSK